MTLSPATDQAPEKNSPGPFSLTAPTYCMFSINSTNVVNVTGLFDSIAGTYVNDAVVTAVLKDSTGAAVYTFPLSYLAASSGNYRGNIPYATASTLTPGAKYTLFLTATSGGNQLYLAESDNANYSA